MLKKKKKRPKQISNHQWVYIMSNASMPGLIKIGMTTTSPSQRNKELGAATGVPTPFKLEYALEVSNARYIEQRIHQKLSRYRINRRREFFEVDVKTAIKALKMVAKRRHFSATGALGPLAWLMEVLVAGLILYIIVR